MKVTALTTDQQAQMATLKAAVTAAQTQAQTAAAALRTAMCEIIGPTPLRTRVQLSEDGTSLIQG